MAGRKLLALVVFSVFIWQFYSCSKDKTQLPTVTPNACDSLNPSYATCIQPILTSQCYPCHSDSASENGSLCWDMQNFPTLKNYLNSYYHNDSIYGSKFLAVIGNKLDVIHMPPSGPGLPLSDFNLIQSWIKNGALNN